MSRLADRLSHSDQLRALREQAELAMGAARPVVAGAAKAARETVDDVQTAVADPVRRILDYLPTVLDIVATFRARSVHAAERATGAVQDAMPTRKQALAYMPSRPAVMATVRPVLLGMAIAAAGYAAYRYGRSYADR